jgi:hypothetical protein
VQYCDCSRHKPTYSRLHQSIISIGRGCVQRNSVTRASRGYPCSISAGLERLREGASFQHVAPAFIPLDAYAMQQDCVELECSEAQDQRVTREWNNPSPQKASALHRYQYEVRLGTKVHVQGSLNCGAHTGAARWQDVYAEPRWVRKALGAPSA